MSARGAGGLLLRQARAHWPVLAVLALLVFLSAFLAAAAPRAFTVVADKALFAAVEDAPVGASEITARSTNDLPWTQLRDVDAQLVDVMPEPLTKVLGERTLGVTSARYQTLKPGSGEPTRPQPYAWLTLRYQSGLLDRVRWIEGSAPKRTVPPRDGAPARMEIALAEGPAGRLDLAVGDHVQLDFVDEPIGGGRPPIVVVSGLFQPLDKAETAWGHEPLVLSPGVEVSPSGETVAEYAAALISEQQVPVLQKAAPVLSFDWHYQLHADALNSGNAAAVRAALEQTLATGISMDDPASRPMMGVPPSLSITSGILERLDGYTAEARTAEAVSSLMLAGLFAVALLVLALAAQVSVQRRAPALALNRSRGASSRQVAGVLAVETALVALPAAVVGYGAAAELVSSRFSALSVVLVAVLLVASVAFVSFSGGAAFRTTGGVGVGRTEVRRSRRRLVVEAVVVALAVAGLGLLRRRGLESSADGADLFLAATPVLFAVAAGVLALRAYPWLLRFLLRLVRGHAGAVSFISFSQGARQTTASTLPMAVLLLALGFAVFSSAVRVTIDEGQAAAAWAQVGADYRISTGGVFLPAEIADLIAVEGVAAAVPAVAPADSFVRSADGRPLAVRVLAIDPKHYDDVVEAAPEGVVPDLQTMELRPRARHEVLPALVSPGVAQLASEGRVEVNPGSGISDFTVGVRRVAETFPTDGGGDFVVVHLSAFQALQEVAQRPNEVFVEAPTSAATSIESTTESWGGSVVVADRAALLATTARTPLVEGTAAAFRRGVLAVAAYCLLATLLALVLTARSRTQLLSVLHTLGMNRRQTLAVAALELAPAYCVIVATGWLVGLALPYLLVPAIDLRPFTGGWVAPQIRVDLVAAGLLGLALVAVVAVAVVVTLTIGRRRRIGPASSTGDT